MAISDITIIFRTPSPFYSTGPNKEVFKKYPPVYEPLRPVPGGCVFDAYFQPAAVWTAILSEAVSVSVTLAELL